MSGYGNFASVYDTLMTDVNYKARADYLVSVFEKHRQVPKELIDLGCGTAELDICLLEKGIDVIGVDGSPVMLMQARQKTFEKGFEPLLLCQDFTELDLYGTAEGAISTLDCLNHLPDEKALEQTFSRLKYFIEPDGLFVFDVNTPYKHKCVLSKSTFIRDMDDVYCVWQNSECDKDFRVNISLDIFTKDEDGRYDLFSEEFCEIAFTNEQIFKAAKKNKFELVAVYDDMSFNAPKDDSQRLVYVMRRK